MSPSCDLNSRIFGKFLPLINYSNDFMNVSIFSMNVKDNYLTDSLPFHNLFWILLLPIMLFLLYKFYMIRKPRGGERAPRAKFTSTTVYKFRESNNPSEPSVNLYIDKNKYTQGDPLTPHTVRAGIEYPDQWENNGARVFSSFATGYVGIPAWTGTNEKVEDFLYRNVKFHCACPDPTCPTRISEIDLRVVIKGAKNPHLLDIPVEYPVLLEDEWWQLRLTQLFHRY